MRKFFLPPERKRLRGRSTLKAKKKAARLYSLPSSTKKALPLYASFQVPLFSLAILLRDRPDLISGPVALVSCAPDSDTSTPSTTAKPVILAVNHEAARYRVTEGLSPTKALARCPHLNLISSNPADECLHQNALREYLASLGSDFEETAMGVFILDLMSIPHAMKFPGEWVEQALRKATPLRLPLDVALARTPDLSILAGQSPALRHTLRFNSDPIFCMAQHPTFAIQHIDSQPVHSLNCVSTEITLEAELLSLWGIETLGQLANLPRQGLAERLGPEAKIAHDVLHGKHHRLLRLHRPPERFNLSQQLEYPIETMEPLLFALHRGLRTLCSRLQSSQRAASSLRITLTFDDGDLYAHKIELPEPTCDSSLLLRVIQTHLSTIHAPAPATGWSLHLTSASHEGKQYHLFKRSLKNSRRFMNTLGRINALLGPGRLGVPFLLDTHRPDSFQIKGALCSDNIAAKKDQNGYNSSPRCGLIQNGTSLPLSRFRPTLPIHVVSDPEGRFPKPLALLNGPYCGPVTTSNGPFPISGHWWDPVERWQQVEWDIQLTSNVLLRLAYHSPNHWVLEGIYQ